MSSQLGILIMLNNYLHDFAAGIVLAVAIGVYLLAKQVGKRRSPETEELFQRVYQAFAKITFGGLVVIFLGGIVRTIFYRQYEWAPAAGAGQVPALLIKHVLLFAGVIFALYLQFVRARQVLR